jgi:outer membrane protein assembly factor BamB
MSSGRRRLLVCLAVGGVLVVVVVVWALLRTEGSTEEPVGVDFIGAGLAGSASGPTSTPEALWSQEVDCWICQVAATESSVVVYENQEEGGADLRVLDARSGDEVWSERLAPGVIPSTAVWNDMVLLSIGGNGPKQVIAYDSATGEELWRHEGGSLSWFSDDGETVVATELDDDLRETSHLLDANDGRRLWTVQGAPAGRCGDRYLIEGPRGMAIVAADSGEEQWSADGEIVSSTCTDAAALLLRDDEHVALDLDSGDELWSMPASWSDDAVSTVVDDVLVVSDESGTVGLSTSDGSELWSADVEVSEVRGLRLIEGSSSLAFVLDDRILLLDPSTGEAVKSLPLGDLASMRFGPEALVVLDGDTLESRGLDDLERQWAIDVGEDAKGLAVAEGVAVVVTDDEVIAYG